ncbi:MAG: anti-sigma factor antagonist [Frankiales bacterium]|jgi:anti-sigma B factor antagonist|nr:anti-sigma factor antagonist [Frankiales bacterium]
MGLTVSTGQNGPFTVVTISGEIDIATVPQLRDALETPLHQTDPCLILDLTDVRFCDSSGLALLVATRRRLPDGAPLRLAGAQPIVARVFQLTGLTHVLPMFATVSDAVAASDTART